MEFVAPHLDYHALAPEIVLAATFVVVLFVDLIGERTKPLLGTITGLGLLGSMLPVLSTSRANFWPTCRAK